MTEAPWPMVKNKLHSARRFLAWHGLVSDHVRLEGVVLPAKHLRLGGAEFKDDAFFLASGRLEVKRLAEKCGLTPQSRILDVGCGVGRLAIGMLSSMAPPAGYWGLDVDVRSLNWCRRHIAREHSGFHFDQINARNRRYNPGGEQVDANFHLPYEDGAFSVIYLYSVFSHMMPEDLTAYLSEFRRLLAPTGSVFLTAFVEEGVPDAMENPPHYRMAWNGALHCVRYDKKFLEALLRYAGFDLREFEYGKETDGQSAVYLSVT